ncbi:MAG: TATA-binding protein-associated factor mot1 [Vezdaea aestivalis]|nr:MAG: TATA-binding protein-associated factor mot1 [Vezdaea aestivalis]
MTSRLDRLVTLLETGSTQLIRNTAAQQLADVQKAHPDELFNLLTRVVPFLTAKSWETRTAAAKAIAGIVDHAEPFEANPANETNGFHGKSSLENRLDDLLHLETLDISSILKHGRKLLGNAGREHNWSMANLDPVARLAYQKKDLFKRLGMDGEYIESEFAPEEEANSLNRKLSRIDTTSTLQSRQNSVASPAIYTATSPNEGVPQTPLDDNSLSKRQLNALKRKNKMQAKSGPNKVRIVDLSARRPSMDQSQSALDPEPFAIKTEESAVSDYFSTNRPDGGDDDSKIVSEFKGPAVPEMSAILQTDEEQSGHEWPFERLCEFLCADLFDPCWETRHGAAMGLREIVRVHGAGAGRKKGSSRQHNDESNRQWLDDLACRLCCVFMLDRFGDYISDNVVAPIRETVGQTLGALLLHLPAASVESVYAILHRLVMQDQTEFSGRIWEVCHGGMLGMKYLVAIRNDMLLKSDALIDGVAQAVLKGLGDYDDDVRAVSAATLIPIATEFVQLRPGSLRSLINVVWDCLSDIRDDLSASTGSVMDLLARLCSFPEVLEAMKQNAASDPEQSFSLLVPRLYPFLRHTITSVRLAVLRALQTFLKLQEDDGEGWVNGMSLRLVYQNLLVERNDAVLNLSLQLWLDMATSVRSRFQSLLETHLEPMLTLALSPIGVSRHPLIMDRSLFMRATGQMYALPAPVPRKRSPSSVSEPASKRRRKVEKKEEPPPSSHNVDGHMLAGDIDLVGMDVLIRSKTFAARALGKAIWLTDGNSGSPALETQIFGALESGHASTRVTAATLVEEYAKCLGADQKPPASFVQRIRTALATPCPDYYTDLMSYTQVVRAQSHSLLNTFRDIGKIPSSKIPVLAVVVQGEDGCGPDAFSIANAEKIASTDYDRLFKALAPANRIVSTQVLADSRLTLQASVEEAVRFKSQRDVRVIAAVAGALVALHDIPKKPSAVIKGLMDSIKAEENVELQKRSAASVASLITQLIQLQRPAVVGKIISNLVKFCCQDTSETPEFHFNAKFQNSVLSLRKEEDRVERADVVKFEREVRLAKIQRRGSKEGLENLLVCFGKDSLSSLAKLKNLIENPLKLAFEGDLPADITDENNALGQEVVDGMSMLRSLSPSFHPDLHTFVLGLVPFVVKALWSKLSVLRYAAAKCLATICSVITVKGMTMLVEDVLPSIGNGLELSHRQGAIECVYHLIHVMEATILPYVIFLIVPVLGRMSDSDEDVRLIATTTFATLVKLVPLEVGIPDPPGMSESLLKGRERERQFIAQMLDPGKVEPFEMPVAIKAELRSYQQEGVNWLAFLNRYHLHGILCDDMGLGKTLQTLCIVASDHHMRAEEFQKTGAPEYRRLPSLIVCPPTLSGHWQQEIQTYAPFLSCLAFVGSPNVRAALKADLGTTDIVITSYDICRNDIDILGKLNWNYCVLDEGHIIKNPRAKSTMAVKRLLSNHRLILSGTPIQNNVLELWSLFDFLMPGFLGTEKVFHDRFAKPIAASRFSRSSSKEQEAGALAIEALHKQVLPFLLRRLKEEVLDDLPPKILQNYYCDLSELQKKLFEDFTKREGKILADKAATGDKEAKQHIFQALQYMRKLCNSPALVLKEGHKQYGEVTKSLAQKGSKLTDLIHAPKLLALKDLLLDCGIGANPASSGPNIESLSDLAPDQTYVSPHRALIFCQMKEMLDIVQTEVFHKMLPSVQYLRLDGSVEASKRQDIVNRFNSDPSFDALLLTTSVGGLGLNLTGADTVIFVEHDWNPQKDLQAMDRAHRIGQRKVVNVYRLVTRGTVEEKILNLQRFKIDVASTVINQQNAGLASMETSQILDLFNLSDSATTSNATLEKPLAIDAPPKPLAAEDEDAVLDIDGNMKEKGKRGFLDDVGELWDESLYAEEYDLDAFLRGMKG